MMLYLVWDSESEQTKDCTLLTSGMKVVDDDSDAPGHKRKRSRRSPKDDESESEESSEESESKSETQEWFLGGWSNASFEHRPTM